MQFNTDIAAIEPSMSVTLMAKAKKMQKEGMPVINLTAGEPDFDTPEKIKNEAYDQIRSGYTHYTDSHGEPELLEAIAEKLKRENDASFSPEHILVTPGGKYAVYLVIRSILNRGDEAIWLSPGWVSYPSLIEASGGAPVQVRLKYEESYKITYEALEAAVSEKTKLLIINYPNNPTGKMLTKEDLAALSKFLLNHPDIYVLSDEIYERIVYDGKKAISLASYPEFFRRVIIVNGFSKSVAMTGWRIGYLACADTDLYKIIHKLFSHTMSCTSGFVQRAAAKAFLCGKDTEKMRIEYEKRRDFLLEEIEKIPGVEFESPDGAFYAWLRFDTKKTSMELSDELLSKAYIAGVPGEAYGEDRVTCVRFSFATGMDVLGKFTEALREFVADGNL